MAALNPQRARILIGGLIAAGLIFTVLVLALDEDGRPGFPAGLRLPAETAEGASWSPDGRWIAIPNRAGVLLRAADGDSVRQLRAPRTPRYKGWIPGRIGWSSEGKRLRYVTTVGPEESKGSWVTEVPTNGGAVRQVSLGTDVLDADWGSRGWPLVYVPAAGGIWSLASFGAEPVKLLDRPGREEEPRVSPDGTRILFTLTPQEQPDELWIARADGSGARHIGGRFSFLHASWAPDSRRIAVIGAGARTNGAPWLYVVAARTGTRRIVRFTAGAAWYPAWTPGGRWITYALREGQIQKTRPRGEVVELADFRGELVSNLLWSPDGKKLAYSSVEAPEPP